MKASFFSARNCFILGAVLFSLQVIPRWWGDSIVMDEEWELTSAYYFWKTADNPGQVQPSAFGALAAVPLLFMDLKTDPSVFPNYENRSFSFLYLKNLDRLPWITIWARAVTLVFGLLTGFLLYRLTKDAHHAERIAAIVLWAFEPNLLAFTGTAKPDVPAAFWFFLCMVCLAELKKESRPLSFAWFGVLAGLAVTCRYNGIFILPIILVLGFFYWRTSKGFWSIKEAAPKIPAILLGFTGTLFIAFLPSTLLDPGHPEPFHFYFNNLKVMAAMSSRFSDFPLFFAGRLWEQGSFLFFPHQFFLKNTVPFLIFLVLGIVLALRGKINIPLWIGAAPLLYLGEYWLLNRNMAVRQALYAYPFLILISAKAFLWLWKACRPSRSRVIRSLPILLLAWHPISVLCNFPHHIAYANDFLTDRQKPEQLSKFNCSLDQDVKRLAETARERGWKNVKLLSSGRTDPYFYGLDWGPWTLRDIAAPQPGTVYVVDPFLMRQNWIYAAFFRSKNSWVGRLGPTGDIGGTFDYYEFPGEPQPDPSPAINSFPYYINGVPPYRRVNSIPLQLR